MNHSSDNIPNLDMQSPDIVSDNIQKIAELFPNCVTEGPDGKTIDFDLLKQELSSDIVEGNKERYRLEWPGKREAIVTANIPTTKTLRPIREDSVDFDTTENIYIEGDNLEVLKILQESYLGKIKMIYIDPPYNTGKDFVYKDNFSKDAQEELKESGQKDEYNQRLVANPETAGRYHSDWLSMMYPRLKLARNLLRVDGVIFISIADEELHNLRKLGDEVFGEMNFAGNFIWKKKQGGGNDSNVLVTEHEYIIAYSKDIKGFTFNLDKNYKLDDALYPNKDEKGEYGLVTLDKSSIRFSETLVFEIKDPEGNVYYPRIVKGKQSCWRWGQKKVNEDYDDLVFKNGKVYTKYYRPDGITPKSLLVDTIYGRTETGNDDIKKIFDNKNPFSYPKPVSLVKHFSMIGSSDGDIVLDFYSGSATSAQAVLEINSQDGVNRKFIQVQLSEVTDEKSEAYKAGYKNICEIGKERIRRAAKKIVNEQLLMVKESKEKLEEMINGPLLMVNGLWTFGEGVLIDEKAEASLKEINNLQSSIDNLDTGFRVFRLDESNMQDVYYTPQDYDQQNLDLFADNVKPDRTAEDLLTQVILDWGLPLSLKIDKVDIEGKEVFKVAGNSLYACFDRGVDEAFAKAIAKEQPLRIVFKDASFKDDTAKTNVKQLLKQLSPETEMRVI